VTFPFQPSVIFDFLVFVDFTPTYSFTLKDGSATVVANIADAHPPETRQTGVLGYVADDANANKYVAMVVRSNPSVLPGLKDRWEVVVVDRVAKTGASVPISGHNFDPLGAETISCSGVGIAK